VGFFRSQIKLSLVLKKECHSIVLTFYTLKTGGFMTHLHFTGILTANTSHKLSDWLNVQLSRFHVSSAVTNLLNYSNQPLEGTIHLHQYEVIDSFNLPLLFSKVNFQINRSYCTMIDRVLYLITEVFPILTEERTVAHQIKSVALTIPLVDNWESLATNYQLIPKGVEQHFIQPMGYYQQMSLHSIQFTY
jgi:hypothetical protein